MALRPDIILAGQTPDIIGTLARSTQAAAQRNELTRQNALSDLYRTQGAGIAAGDPGAVNALAGYDPYAAMQVQDTITQRGYAAAQEGRAQSAAARAAAEWAQQQDAATVAAERAKLAEALSGAAYFHQRGDRAGYDAFLRARGEDPAQYPFEQFPAIAAPLGEVLEVWQGFAPPAPPDPIKGAPTGYMFNDPNNPGAGVTPLPGYKREPGVVVNTGDAGGARAEIGTVPQGYAAIPDPSNPAGYRMERIPGGPEDNAAAVALQAEGVARSSQVVLEDIGRLREAIKGAPFYNPATGFGAERLSEVGGTNAADAKAIVDTLSANIGFDRLQQMREASPTGGALGAISDTEMRLLSSVLGSLSQRQSAAQFQENLDRLEVIYTAIATKAAAYPGQVGASNPAPQPAPQAVPPGQPVVIDGFTIEAIE